MQSTNGAVGDGKAGAGTMGVPSPRQDFQPAGCSTPDLGDLHEGEGPGLWDGLELTVQFYPS